MGGSSTMMTERRQCQALIVDGSRQCGNAARPDCERCTAHFFASSTCSGKEEMGIETKKYKTKENIKKEKKKKSSKSLGDVGTAPPLPYEYSELAPAVARMAQRKWRSSEPDEDDSDDDESIIDSCSGSSTATMPAAADVTQVLREVVGPRAQGMAKVMRALGKMGL